MGISEELESAIDIVELVGRYAKLKKAGTNYKTVCPFPGHNEKTPSFMVSPSKQLAYCFGCQRGGGPIKFLMDIENIEFKEAIQILGQITGIEVKAGNAEEEKIARNLYGLFKDAVNYYSNTLGKYDKIKTYLLERGLNDEMIKDFHIGFSDSGLELYNYLKSKGYEDDLIKESNIFLDIRSKKDKFLNRIIFPIRNARGDFVALAGRIVGQGEPKYLNSPASKIYDKSSILYGLYLARHEITKKDFVIITEGYMDTIALHQAGFNNSVCVSGTALTEKHIPIIKRLTKKIYLCFDNDKAGDQATKLSIEMLKNKEMEVHIILLKGGKDPDEIIEKNGKEYFEKLINNAVSPIGYLIEKAKKAYDLSSLEEKKKLLSLLLGVLKSYSNQIEVDFYLKEISSLLDINKDIVYTEYNRVKLKREQIVKTVVKNAINTEDIIISYLINKSDFINIAKEKIIFKDKIGKNLSKIIENGIKEVDNFLLEEKEKYKALAAKDEERLMHENDEKIEIEFIKTIEKLNLDIYKKLQSELKQKMEAGDMEALKEYTQLSKLGLKK